MTLRRRAPRTPEQRQQQWTRSLIPGSLGGGVANASPILPGVVDGRALARGAGGAFGASGSVLAYQDVFTLAADGVQAETLTYLPITHSEHVYLNGLYQRETDDWIRSDRAINVQAGMDARVGDVLAVEYLYASDRPAPVTDVLTGYPGEVMTDSPTAYWRLTEPSGTAVEDFSGNGHDGTTANSPTRGTAGLLPSEPASTSTRFDSYAARVEVPLHADFNVSAFTIEFLSTKGGGTTGVVWLQPGRLRIAISGGSTSLMVWLSGGWVEAHRFAGHGGSDDVPIYHVVYVYDGTTWGRYLDGVFDAGVVYDSSPLPAATAGPQLGNGLDGISDGWSYRLQEYAFYPQVLSASRVAAHVAAR